MSSSQDEKNNSDCESSDSELIVTCKRGPRGKRGHPGKTILSGECEPSKYLGCNGDFYININTSIMYGPKHHKHWPVCVNLCGCNAQTTFCGTTIPSGINVLPSGTPLQNGMIYIYTGTTPPTFYIYVSCLSQWVEFGGSGTIGTSIYTGIGAPSGTNYNDGDLYIDTSTGEVYQYEGGWGDFLFSMIGPTGSQGNPGDAGLPGNSGQIIPYTSGTTNSAIVDSGYTDGDGNQFLGTGTVLGFGTSFSDFDISNPNPTNPSINFIGTQALSTAYTVPIAGTITQLISTFIATNTTSIDLSSFPPNSQLEIDIQIYTNINESGNDTFTSQGNYAIGTYPIPSSSGINEGDEISSTSNPSTSPPLNISVNAGDRIIVIVMIPSFSSSPGSTKVPGNVTATLVIS